MRLYKLTPVLFIAFLAFFMVGSPWLPISDPVESNYALTAKEMFLSGDWMSPTIYGQYWYDKPIMIYWLIAFSYKIFGLTDWAARLPSALFGAASVALLYQLVKASSKRRILSLLSATILGTSLLFWPIAHGIITDMVLLFATVGIMGYAYRGLILGRTSLIAVAYGFSGLAVLAKGPVGLVLPGFLLLLFAFYMKSWRMVKQLFCWQGILVFCLVALPWYGYMYTVHGQDFIDGFLGLNNVVRATVSEHPEDNIWWYYLAIFLGASLPWTGSVMYGIIQGWKRRHPAYMYAMIWGWGTILFYSLMATKYPTYTFISLIPFSILGAMGLIRMANKASRKWNWILMGPAFTLWIAYLVGTYFVPWGFWYLLYIAIGAFLLLSLHFYWIRKPFMVSAMVAVGTMVISSLVIIEGLVPLVHERSSQALVPLVSEWQGPIYQYDAYTTSLVYYTGHTITKVNGPSLGRRGAAWDGKYRMPQVEEDTFAKQVSQMTEQGQEVLLLVGRGQKKDFDVSGLRPLFSEYQQVGRMYIYKNF